MASIVFTTASGTTTVTAADGSGDQAVSIPRTSTLVGTDIANTFTANQTFDGGDVVINNGNLTATGTGSFTSTINANGGTVAHAGTQAFSKYTSTGGLVFSAGSNIYSRGANVYAIGDDTSATASFYIDGNQDVFIPAGNLTVTGNSTINNGNFSQTSLETTSIASTLNLNSLTAGVGLYVNTYNASYAGNGLIQGYIASGSASGVGIKVINEGTGDSVFIDNNGSGNALYTDGGDVVINNGTVTCYSDFGSGALSRNYTARPPGGTNGQTSGYTFYSTFTNFPSDVNPRRSADIWSGYSNGIWGNEYLAFGVGGSSDAQPITTERMRLTATGNLSVTGQYIEEYAATGTSGAVTIDLDTGNNFSTAMAGTVTYTFSNAATSGKVSSFTLKVVNDGSAITWPTSVDWPAATAPTLSASGATDYFVFITHDGGTTWYGFTAGQGMA